MRLIKIPRKGLTIECRQETPGDPMVIGAVSARRDQFDFYCLNLASGTMTDRGH